MGFKVGDGPSPGCFPRPRASPPASAICGSTAWSASTSSSKAIAPSN